MARTPTPLQRYLRFSTMGLELGLSVIIGIGFGWWLDSKLGSTPWLMMLFTVLGMAAGFLSVFRRLREFTRSQGGAE
jgi:ATP synthase protein I